MAAKINLVTARSGSSHVSSADFGSMLAALFGRGNYVLYGFEAELINNNLVRVKSGDVLMNGRHIRIDTDQSVDLQIRNGAQSVSRIDSIILRYTEDAQGHESAEIDIISGAESGGTPDEPEIITDSILDGAVVAEMRLYNITIKGVTASEPVICFERLPSLVSVIKEMVTPPIGDIETNTSGRNPANRYPGTVWEAYGKGRCLVGVDAGNTGMNAPNKNGGSAGIRLTVAQLPSHTHAVKAHFHGLNNHRHPIPSMNANVENAGTHTHKGKYRYTVDADNTYTRNYYFPGGTTTSTEDMVTPAGSHAHKVTIPIGYNTEPNNGNTTTSGAHTSGETGSGAEISVMQPYVTVYFWRRIS